MRVVWRDGLREKTIAIKFDGLDFPVFTIHQGEGAAVGSAPRKNEIVRILHADDMTAQMVGGYRQVCYFVRLFFVDIVHGDGVFYIRHIATKRDPPTAFMSHDEYILPIVDQARRYRYSAVYRILAVGRRVNNDNFFLSRFQIVVNEYPPVVGKPFYGYKKVGAFGKLCSAPIAFVIMIGCKIVYQ